MDPLCRGLRLDEDDFQIKKEIRLVFECISLGNVTKVPDEARVCQLVHYLNLPHEHPLRLRVQLRLVDQFHSHAVWNELS